MNPILPPHSPSRPAPEKSVRPQTRPTFFRKCSLSQDPVRPQELTYSQKNQGEVQPQDGEPHSVSEGLEETRCVRIPAGRRQMALENAGFTLFFYPLSRACLDPHLSALSVPLYPVKHSPWCWGERHVISSRTFLLSRVQNGIQGSGKCIILFESIRVSTEARHWFPIFKRHRNTQLLKLPCA